MDASASTGRINLDDVLQRRRAWPFVVQGLRDTRVPMAINRSGSPMPRRWAGMRPKDVRIRREQEAIALLRSETPGSLLRDALASAGWHLVDWEPGSVHHRPGAGVTGVFPIEVRAAAGSTRRNRSTTTVAPSHACITTSPLPRASEGVAVFNRRGADALSVWAHPRDPLLPGLPMALDAARITGYAFGPGHEPAATALELRSYRPLRRAVVLAANFAAVWRRSTFR
jgi:hypothetical protein